MEPSKWDQLPEEKKRELVAKWLTDQVVNAKQGIFILKDVKEGVSPPNGNAPILEVTVSFTCFVDELRAWAHGKKLLDY